MTSVSHRKPGTPLLHMVANPGLEPLCPVRGPMKDRATSTHEHGDASGGECPQTKLVGNEGQTPRTAARLPGSQDHENIKKSPPTHR